MFNCSLGDQKDVDRDNIICDLDNQVPSIESNNFQNNIKIDAVYAFAHALHRMQLDYSHLGEGLCTEILESHSQFKQTVIKGELLLQYLHNVSFEGISADRIYSLMKVVINRVAMISLNLQVDPVIEITNI